MINAVRISFVGLAAGILVLNAGYGFAGTGNLVENSSFEILKDGMPEGWRAINNIEKISVDNDIAYHGENSIHFKLDGELTRFAMAENIELSLDKPYTFSIMVKTKNLRPTEAFNIHLINAGWTWSSPLLKIESTSDWQRHALTFSIPESVKIRWASVQIRSKGATGEVWIDAVQVEEGSRATEYQVKEKKGGTKGGLSLITSRQLDHMSLLIGASYLKPTGIEMVRVGGFSPDGGRTWETFALYPDFISALPHGYRREMFPLFVDHASGRIVHIVPSMDTPGLDPEWFEPPIAMEAYYLRYRVSLDGGRTWLFCEQIIQKGHTKENPFDGVYFGKNGIFMGDIGSQLLRTRAGKIIIPANACILGPDGKLWNPGGGWTYTKVIIIIGRWTDNNRLEWEIGEPIKGDPARSTRGMIEPTIAEMPDGRLLCVMRGSNGGWLDPHFRIPSYRWFSVSEDGGHHWTKPKPWTYDDGTPFYSPSSMSQLLTHSSGRVFWLGNISPSNARANHPRHPLFIGEVNPETLSLMKDTLLVIDTKRPEEPDINLSHWWAFEDRETHDIVVVGARHARGYLYRTPWLWRVGVDRRSPSN